MKKLISLILCLCMALSLSVTAFAEDGDNEIVIIDGDTTYYEATQHDIPVVANVQESDVDGGSVGCFAVRISWEGNITVNKQNAYKKVWNTEKFNYSDKHYYSASYSLSSMELVTLTVTNLIPVKVVVSGTFTPVDALATALDGVCVTSTISNMPTASSITLDAATAGQGDAVGTIGGTGKLYLCGGSYLNADDAKAVADYIEENSETSGNVNVGKITISIAQAQ